MSQWNKLHLSNVGFYTCYNQKNKNIFGLPVHIPADGPSRLCLRNLTDPMTEKDTGHSAVISRKMCNYIKQNHEKQSWTIFENNKNKIMS